ncbi:MAG: DUF47 family protein [Methanomassiliicoccales archaeon]|jgi:uncharacterized protein Yka (UPF0111/DUF47 family)|nr:DUF47 family protein [Methanomassiliicoccales archaeon]
MKSIDRSDRNKVGERKKARTTRLIDIIFPPRYDFYGMLQDQAKITARGVKALLEWLKTNDLREPQALIAIEEEADQMRYAMESKLLEAFVTPFDRQDIYSISRQMDYILNYSLSTALEMKAFGVKVDEPIMKMAGALCEGTTILSAAIDSMKFDKKASESMIQEIRKREREIESIYIESMRHIFALNDPITILKKREIYHHLKDAGRTLGITIDILHRIILGID